MRDDPRGPDQGAQMYEDLVSYRRHLEEAGMSSREQLIAGGDLARKVAPMLVRGLVLKTRLKMCNGIPLVGKGVRVRGAQQLSVGSRVVLEDFAEIQATSSEGVVIEDGVSIGSMTMIRPSGYYSRRLGRGLRIGSQTGINGGCYIGCSGGIDIGAHVMLGPGVMLFAEEHTFEDARTSVKQQDVSWQPIVIEDECWLGSRVTVTGGVRIGRGSVVGAGAVVTRDIPEYSVAVGIPARVIRERRARL